MPSPNKVVICTGGYDPLHSGHIAYFQAAKNLGDMLVVGVNSDEWLRRKKGKSFMPLDERMNLIRNLRMVDDVYRFDDSDGSAKDLIYQIRQNFPAAKIIFANGGDRTKNNIPELSVNDHNTEFVFEVGGADKKNSSSYILQEWKEPKTIRQWGYYRVLHDQEGCKVKELTIEPKKSLSMQKHFHRNEYWFISEGSCVVNSMLDSGYMLPSLTLNKHQNHHIEVNQWHQLTNPFDVPCKVIEIQYGDSCYEEDIERKNA